MANPAENPPRHEKDRSHSPDAAATASTDPVNPPLNDADKAKIAKAKEALNAHAEGHGHGPKGPVEKMMAGMKKDVVDSAKWTGRAAGGTYAAGVGGTSLGVLAGGGAWAMGYDWGRLLMAKSALGLGVLIAPVEIWFGITLLPPKLLEWAEQIAKNEKIKFSSGGGGKKSGGGDHKPAGGH